MGDRSLQINISARIRDKRGWLASVLNHVTAVKSLYTVDQGTTHATFCLSKSKITVNGYKNL